MSTATPESGGTTGTKDKDYNLIWFTEQCLSNALRLENYIQNAERDGDQSESHTGAEKGKEQLRKRLAGS
jgi:hypothetical protein